MTPSSTRPPRWDEDRTADFIAMWNAGRTPEEIARRFGISRRTVAGRATHLRRAGHDMTSRSLRRDDEARERRCLGCGQRFMSAHVGNRLCWPCSRDEAREGLV